MSETASIMNPPQTVPVVIAGAGPVGLTLALSLARKGIRSLVLEKKKTLDPHSRATILVASSLELFEELDVLEKCLEQGQRNDAITIVRADDHAKMLSFDFGLLADRTSTPYVLALSQDRAEKILLDAANASQLVEVVFDDGLAEFEHGDQKVHVTSAKGRRIEASFLVGADGARSTVRGHLGLSLEGKTYPTRAVLADVEIAEHADVQGVWLADPDAHSFTIAIRFGDGLWRIIEGAIPDNVTDDMLEARAKQSALSLFGPDSWRSTVWTAAYRKHERRAAHYVVGRVILAGDAAHLNSPAGGQGLNAGIGDVKVLAPAIAQSLANPEQTLPLLDGYQAARIDAFDHDICGFTDGLEMMESSPAWVRKIGFSMVGLLRAIGIEKKVARKLSMLEYD
jgi:3-(3-hydroxy-phenyl)propionate hydroxylase